MKCGGMRKCVDRVFDKHKSDCQKCEEEVYFRMLVESLGFKLTLTTTIEGGNNDNSKRN